MRRGAGVREEEYAQWLRAGVTAVVASNYVARCRRVEQELDVRLDEEYRRDSGASLLESLTYSIDDQRNHRPPR